MNPVSATAEILVYDIALVRCSELWLQREQVLARSRGLHYVNLTLTTVGRPVHAIARL